MTENGPVWASMSENVITSNNDGDNAPLAQGEISLCVCFTKHVWKKPNTCLCGFSTHVWLFPHVCAIKHTCVVKATQLVPV